MQFTLKKGNALLFFPQLADNSTDEQNINAGQILVDNKCIAQIYVNIT